MADKKTGHHILDNQGTVSFHAHKLNTVTRRLKIRKCELEATNLHQS